LRKQRSPTPVHTILNIAIIKFLRRYICPLLPLHTKNIRHAPITILSFPSQLQTHIFLPLSILAQTITARCSFSLRSDCLLQTGSQSMPCDNGLAPHQSTSDGHETIVASLVACPMTNTTDAAQDCPPDASPDIRDHQIYLLNAAQPA
jgi:hypothetical protein